MARINVPVLGTSRLQVIPAFTADLVVGDTVNGMRMSNDGGTVLYVRSSSVAAQTVSLILVETVDFLPVGPAVLTVPALTTAALIGPFPANLYGNVLEFDVSSNTLSFLAFTLL